MRIFQIRGLPLAHQSTGPPGRVPSRGQSRANELSLGKRTPAQGVVAIAGTLLPPSLFPRYFHLLGDNASIFVIYSTNILYLAPCDYLNKIRIAS